MGSIVTLGLGRLEVDWGKNSFFSNHSKLFLPGDKKLVSHFYADPDSDGVLEELKIGLARPLRSVLRRLELLGFTMLAARKHFEELAQGMANHLDVPDIGFDRFADVLAGIDVTKVSLDPFFEDHSLGGFVARSIFSDAEFTKADPEFGKLSRFEGQFFENLDAYIILRLLAQNTANLDTDVQWRYADLIEGGWAVEADLFEGLGPVDRWLVVTEGSSDGAVIRKALQLMRPDIADFFDFVDMSENYPFTGSGNLFRFCQGLAQIKIQNKVLVIFDNDAAGLEAKSKVEKLNLPSNMKVVRLPDLPECSRFLTVGPTGSSEQDINGRAVSIELFLDLRTEKSPCVRWTSHNAVTGSYQGELIGKEAHTKRFLGLRAIETGYDMSKLEKLVDHIYEALVGAP